MPPVTRVSPAIRYCSLSIYHIGLYVQLFVPMDDHVRPRTTTTYNDHSVTLDHSTPGSLNRLHAFIMHVDVCIDDYARGGGIRRTRYLYKIYQISLNARTRMSIDVVWQDCLFINQPASSSIRAASLQSRCISMPLVPSSDKR